MKIIRRLRDALLAAGAVTAAAAASSGSARAQAPDLGLHPSLSESKSPVADAPPPPQTNFQHLFGTWGGTRTWLLEHGIDLIPGYIMEAAGNPVGGLRQGSDYVGRVGLEADIDWDTLAGIPGFKTYTFVIAKFGRDLSADYIGKDPYSVEELYGSIGTLIKLQYAYATLDLDNKNIQLGLGRLNHALLFDTSPIYCSFLSLAICAVPRLMPGGDGDGFYNSAKTNWGGYVRYRPTVDTYIQVGAFESTPLHGGHSGFNFSSNEDVGANFPFQVAWQPGGGAGQLPTHIFAGGYYDTSPYPDVYTDENGNPIALTGMHGKNDHGHTAYWFGADQMIWRNDAPANAGMVLFVNYSATDPHISLYSDQVTVGFEDVGQVPGRPGDSFGAQFTRADQSKYLREEEELQLAAGRGLPKGVYGIQSTEMIAELQYSFRVVPGVDVQPDTQYIIHPGSTKAIPDAWVLALRARVTF
jgi:porin